MNAVSHPRALHVLVLFGEIDRRAKARALCVELAPGCNVTAVSSTTDAVLALLGNCMHIVLADDAVAGDLLHSLAQHTRRTSPGAVLLIFGLEPRLCSWPHDRRHLEVLPWETLQTQLARALSVLLRIGGEDS